MVLNDAQLIVRHHVPEGHLGHVRTEIRGGDAGEDRPLVSMRCQVLERFFGLGTTNRAAAATCPLSSQSWLT